MVRFSTYRRRHCEQQSDEAIPVPSIFTDGIKCAAIVRP
jgi:hypothetical protein